MNIGIARIDWNAFNYIHSGNTRDAFQKLTEQLFCFEFKQPYGVYRYYNQPYIETMPICFGSEVIGFQSKYFDAASNLSDKKTELMDAITSAHRRYPSITKIVFYINKEPALSTSSERDMPQYMESVEAHGTSLGIQIAWKGLNQIETMLLRPELEHIRNYFFLTKGGIKEVIAQILTHSKNVFDSIDVDIQYKKHSIRIPQEIIDIKGFFESGKNVLIVHGDGGSGKSAQVKLQLGEEHDYPVWFFRATDFDTASVPEFTRRFGECSWDELLSAFTDSPRKVCIIDSAEKVFTNTYQDTFISAVHMLKQHGWHIIMTIRTAYWANFQNTILKTSDVFEHHVQPLTMDVAEKLETQYGFSLPTNTKLRDFLCNLFYLKIYLSDDRFASSVTLIEFMDALWSQVICASEKLRNSLNVRRGHMMIHLVKENADKGSAYYVPSSETDWDAITSLNESGIIQHDEIMGGYFICHDVYEEIVLKQIISQAYARKENVLEFFNDIGDSLVMRKAFRSWLHDQFAIEVTGLAPFITEILNENQYPFIWKDEVLITLYNEETESYKCFLGSALKNNDYALLTRALRLLNTACRKIDDDFCKMILTPEELKTFNTYRFTKPSGNGWNYLISFTYEQRENIPWSAINIAYIADVLYSWTQATKEGETTRQAGLLALYLYQITDGYSLRHILCENKLSHIYDAIFNSSKEIHPELSDILETLISQNATNHRDKYTKLCEHLLNNSFCTGTLCAVDPDLVIKLAQLFWLDEDYTAEKSDYGIDCGVDFGLRHSTDHMYYPSSAFQTPVLSLLQASPLKAIDFIIELFDKVTLAYTNSHLNKDYRECQEIELSFSNGTHAKQIASDRLWKMHRGTSVAPNLLESVLMALERWLDQLIKSTSQKVAEDVCFKLLSNSHSAAITAVVTSMVIAYPNVLFNIACILLHTRELFILDISRFISEQGSNFLRGGMPNNEIYDTERINTNKLPFRQKRLEDIILEYQINHFELSEEDFQTKLNLLYKAIDEGFTPEDRLTESEQFVLYRMDMRRMKLVQEKTAVNEDCFALVSDLPPHLVQVQNDHKVTTKNDDCYLQLDLWSHYRYSRDVESYSKYKQYESNPAAAFDDALRLLDEPSSLQIDNRFMLYVAAVLLMDFQKSLTEEQVSICSEIIINYLHTVIDEHGVHSLGDGTDAAISALPCLFGRFKDGKALDDPAILLLMLMCDWGKQRDWAIYAFREKVWVKNQTLAQSLLTLFILLKPGYDSEVSRHNGVSPKAYFEKNISLIDSVLRGTPQSLPDITKLSKNALLTLNLFLPACQNSYEFEVITQSGAILWPLFFADSRRNLEREKFRDYELEHDYVVWLAECLLTSTQPFQKQIIESLVKHLSISEHVNKLLTSLILKQDRIEDSTSFWFVWDELFDAIKELCEHQREGIIYNCEHNNDQYYGGELDEIITTYLFAMPWWKKGIHEWHTLGTDNTLFFSKAVDSFGYHPGVLYSVSCILNSVGYQYINEGVKWLAKTIHNNPHLRNSVLQVNTEYYIEEYMQRFINTYHDEIKKSHELRNDVIEVLSFLVDRGSTCGFMLRENMS